MKFEKLIRELDRLKLPKSGYVIFGSGPLSVRGIRESNDIDILVAQDLWEKLAKEHRPDNRRTIKIGSVEIYKDWKPWFDDARELFRDSELINRRRFVRLKYVILWKEAFNRDKDKKDLILIKEYLAKEQKPRIN
jgi:predicted nucleotidyltransferase